MEHYLTKQKIINTTFSSIQSTPQSRVDPLVISASVVSGIISFFAIFGNLFNIIFIWRTPALHNLNNLIILNLSFVDFLNGLVVLPSIIVLIVAEKLPYPICQFQGFILYLMYTASLTTSSAISFDRLIAIMYPFRYYSNITVRKVTIIMICIWLIPIIIATVPLLGLQQFGLGQYRKIYICVISFTYYNENYIVCWTLIISIAVIITSIICIYAVIFFIAYRKTTQDLTRGSNLKKSIRTTALIVGTNLICWLPFLISNYQMYSDAVQPSTLATSTPPGEDVDSSSVVIVTLLFGNAAINPIIYMITNRHIKKHLSLLFHNNRVHGFS